MRAGMRRKWSPASAAARPFTHPPGAAPSPTTEQQLVSLPERLAARPGPTPARPPALQHVVSQREQSVAPVTLLRIDAKHGQAGGILRGALTLRDASDAMNALTFGTHCPDSGRQWQVAMPSAASLLNPHHRLWCRPPTCDRWAMSVMQRASL